MWPSCVLKDMDTKAFRISKTDLRIRPIYHRLQRRIEAHICIAFCAYKIFKELERLLKEKKAGLSPEKAIDILKTIYKVTITLPYSKTNESRLFLPNEEQRTLLKLFQITWTLGWPSEEDRWPGRSTLVYCATCVFIRLTEVSKVCGRLNYWLLKAAVKKSPVTVKNSRAFAFWKLFLHMLHYLLPKLRALQ